MTETQHVSTMVLYDIFICIHYLEPMKWVGCDDSLSHTDGGDGLILSWNSQKVKSNWLYVGLDFLLVIMSQDFLPTFFLSLMFEDMFHFANQVYRVFQCIPRQHQVPRMERVLWEILLLWHESHSSSVLTRLFVVKREQIYRVGSSLHCGLLRHFSPWRLP